VSTWLSGPPLPYPDGTVLLHERGRCAGVVAGGTLYTHNMELRPSRPEKWRPVERDQITSRRVLGLLAAATDRARDAGGRP
jgi:hypothetical protein